MKAKLFLYSLFLSFPAFTHAELKKLSKLTYLTMIPLGFATDYYFNRTFPNGLVCCSWYLFKKEKWKNFLEDLHKKTNHHLSGQDFYKKATENNIPDDTSLESLRTKAAYLNHCLNALYVPDEEDQKEKNEILAHLPNFYTSSLLNPLAHCTDKIFSALYAGWVERTLQFFNKIAQKETLQEQERISKR